ncbi:PepSY domain-containing protein [Ruminococcaceae bacterium OttesenSCG-928-I18]|nr:PepSY domain-containing protein [Ruminococcaceae bacterium OttesenSCG-928-I18]
MNRNKKKIPLWCLTVLLSCGLVFVLFGCAAEEPPASASTPPASSAAPAAAASSSQPASSAAAQQAGGSIGFDAAIAIGLEQAGVAESDVTFSNAHLETEDGVQVYDVVIVTHDTVYKYTVHATSGDVLEAEQEVNDNFEATGGPQGDYIGVDAALQIALEHAGLNESDVTVTKARQDEDDGVIIYEIEFTSGGQDYDYDVDATTGEIIKYEVDNDD